MSKPMNKQTSDLGDSILYKGMVISYVLSLSLSLPVLRCWEALGVM